MGVVFRGDGGTRARASDASGWRARRALRHGRAMRWEVSTWRCNGEMKERLSSFAAGFALEIWSGRVGPEVWDGRSRRA